MDDQVTISSDIDVPVTLNEVLSQLSRDPEGYKSFQLALARAQVMKLQSQNGHQESHHGEAG